MTPANGKSRPPDRKRLFLLPSPCPKATVDIEKISYLLRSRGLGIAHNPADADIVITWGCGFIDDAKQESIDDILNAVAMKKDGEVGAVIVAGCLPEKFGDDLAESIPEVDAFIGSSSLARLPEVVEHLLKGEEVRKVWLTRPFMEFDPGCERDLTGDSPWTRTLLLCHGCDNRCTYCTIPQMRGNLKSRAPEDILREARLLVEEGAEEIVLAGQDIASYGRDRDGLGLRALLERIAEESGAHWIRLCYAHPDNLDPGVADVMAAYPNVCRYIDMPIQHAAPEILRAMGRNPDPGAIAEKVSYMKARVPDIAIRTSVIVGFPGEREIDFEYLLGFLKEVDFDLIGVFEFSPQPQTVAEHLEPAVPDFVRQERLVDIVRLQEEVSESHVARLIGKRVEILIEERCGDLAAVGRSQYDAPDVDRRVRVAGCRAGPGEFVTARLTGYSAWGHIDAVCE